MRRTLCAISMLLIGALPATASAASITNANGTLTVVMTPDRASSLTVGLDNGQVYVMLDDPDRQITGCPNTFSIRCDGVTRVEATGSSSYDYMRVQDAIPSHLVGGAGNDGLTGSNGAPDVLDGGPGNDDLQGEWISPDSTVADVLNGGDGDDSLLSKGGGDTISGGAGIDRLLYWRTGSEPVTITLDGIANDGIAGEGANFQPDIEDLDAFSPGAVTLTGSAAANTLTTSYGNDVITGGDGSDALDSQAGDDTLNARDGYPDRVQCGAGDDTVVADTHDQVGADCEHVSIADVGSAFDDHPPTVAWAQSQARMSANATATLSVTATDDKAVASVKFLSASRVLCVDSTAPYSCAFRPRGADVGRTTLTAIVSDTSGQTASIVRTLSITKFKASKLSLQVTRTGVARGKLTVSTRATCSGSVRVAGRTARLSRGCRYSVRLPHRHGRAVASFAGTKQIAPRRSSARKF